MATTVSNTAGTGVTTVQTIAATRRCYNTAQIAAYEVATPTTIYDVGYYRSAIFNGYTSGAGIGGTDTITIAIEHSMDGTNFTELCALPAIDYNAADYKQNKAIAASNIGRYIRVHQKAGANFAEAADELYTVVATLKK